MSDNKKLLWLKSVFFQKLVCEMTQIHAEMA